MKDKLLEKLLLRIQKAVMGNVKSAFHAHLELDQKYIGSVEKRVVSGMKQEMKKALSEAHEAGKREGLTKSQVEVLLWRPVMHRDKVSEEDVKVILDNIDENK